MADGSGALKLYVGTNADRLSGIWLTLHRSGMPLLTEPARARPNDCVLLAGRAGLSGLRASRYAVGVGRTGGKDNELKAEAGRRIESAGVSPVSPWLMNAAARDMAALSAKELERRLRREGLPARIGEESGGTPVSVSVWAFEAVEMRREFVKDRFVDKDAIQDDHPIWKPAERLAVRAVYSSGLDFGQVLLRLSDEGKLRVTGVSPALDVRSSAGAAKLTAAIAAFSAEWAKETSGAGARAVLGADPEFVMVSAAGRVVPASRYFAPGDATGCDSIRLRGVKIWPLVELRPRPSRDPARLTAELRRLLGAAAERTDGAALSWRAGALPVKGIPLGGHIHLSGAALHAERVRALDNAVALPLRLLEPPGAARRRPRYGALGDVRRQPHGGFEYRTPPSWLVSPRLTLGALALAKVAAEHARELASERPLDADEVRDAFYAGDRAVLTDAAERVYRAIRRTQGYAEYRDAIDFVFDAVARGRIWDESEDIRLKWRIPVR